MTTMPAAERFILDIDTWDENRVERLAALAKAAGIKTVQFGQELASGLGWMYASLVARKRELNWVAHTELSASASVMGTVVKNLVELNHPPRFITMHAASGMEAMQAARKVVEDTETMLLGIVVPPHMSPGEARHVYEEEREAALQRLTSCAALSGLHGVIVRPNEVASIENGTYMHDHRVRPVWRNEVTLPSFITVASGPQMGGLAPWEQNRYGNAIEALRSGAQFAVIDHVITGAEDPAAALDTLVRRLTPAA